MDTGSQVALVGHRGEIHDRGGAAPDGPQGVIQGPGVGGASHQLAGAGLHVGGGVGVGLNAAGHHNLAGGVDDGCLLGGQETGKGHHNNLLPLDSHVPQARA